MKKKIIIICSVVVTAVFAIVIYFLLQNPGRVENAEIHVGNSEKFSQQEIDSAINYAINYFKKEFHGCELIQIKYDEEQSNRIIESDMTYGQDAYNGATEDNVIVLSIDFHTDATGISPGLNSNFTYIGYHYILMRDHQDDEWRMGELSI